MLHGIKKIITSAVDGLRVNVNIDRGRAARKIVRLKARSTATSMNRMNGALRGRRSMLPAAPLCAEAAEPLCAEAAELLCTDAAKPLCTNAASPAGHHAKAADPAGQRAAPLCALCAGPVGQRAAPLCAEAIGLAGHRAAALAGCLPLLVPCGTEVELRPQGAPVLQSLDIHHVVF
jgi:hypothetical protein